MTLRECKPSLGPGEEVQNEPAVLGKEGQGVEVVPRDQAEPVLQGPDKGSYYFCWRRSRREHHDAQVSLLPDHLPFPCRGLAAHCLCPL